MKIKNPKSERTEIKNPIKSIPDLDYPVFCFKHLQTQPKGDHKFYSDFVERLKKLCGLTWNQIGTSDRHSFGTEKLPIKSIKPALPSFVTPEVTHLTVFRANGDNRPFLGIRKGCVFHVVFIEEVFGDIYDHKSK